MNNHESESNEPTRQEHETREALRRLLRLLARDVVRRLKQGKASMPSQREPHSNGRADDGHRPVDPTAHVPTRPTESKSDTSKSKREDPS
jgi:hypothetical protein